MDQPRGPTAVGSAENPPFSTSPATPPRSPGLAREMTVDVTPEAAKPGDESVARMRKSMSLDSAEPEEKKPSSGFTRSSFKRRSVRRRSSKRFDYRPEVTYGNNAGEYEAIRERVLEERAVVNAVEALQERWRMLTYMYDDCVELNEGRKDRRQVKLHVQRQFELIVLVSLFVLACLPLTLIMMFAVRLAR